MASTASPNLLGWDGRRKNGDPDNSALHSASVKDVQIKNVLLFSILISIVSNFFKSSSLI